MANWLLASKLGSILCKMNIPGSLLRDVAFDIFPGNKNILFYVSEDSQLLCQVFDIAFAEGYWIPFIKDVNDRTPIHYVFDDGKLTDIFLTYMKDYPISYYSENMVPLIPFFILKGLQQTGNYLNGRLLSNPYLQQFD